MNAHLAHEVATSCRARGSRSAVRRTTEGVWRGQPRANGGKGIARVTAARDDQRAEKQFALCYPCNCAADGRASIANRRPQLTPECVLASVCHPRAAASPIAASQSHTPSEARRAARTTAAMVALGRRDGASGDTRREHCTSTRLLVGAGRRDKQHRTMTTLTSNCAHVSTTNNVTCIARKREKTMTGQCPYVIFIQVETGLDTPTVSPGALAFRGAHPMEKVRFQRRFLRSCVQLVEFDDINMGEPACPRLLRRRHCLARSFELALRWCKAGMDG
jgi:hypothetical protein